MERLKFLREKMTLSQADVARELNISRQSYNFYENGKRDPDTDTLVKLAKFFNVTTDYLLGVPVPHQPKILSPDRERFLRELSNTDDETAKELQSYLNYLKSKKEQAAMSTAT